MVYRDGFIFVTDVPNGQIHAIDARRPDAPVLIASVQIDANIESAIAQHGSICVCDSNE
jgi:hypothetical protein